MINGSNDNPPKAAATATIITERSQFKIVHDLCQRIVVSIMGFHCFVSTEKKKTRTIKKQKGVRFTFKFMDEINTEQAGIIVVLISVFSTVSFFKFLTGFMFERR